MAQEGKIVLPPKYYLDYFKYVIDFVEDKYNNLLAPTESAFISAFRKLSEDAQCLFVRVTIRKGIYFRTQKFDYEEIHDMVQAREELLHQGFLVLVEDYPEYEEERLLGIFTKGELQAIYGASMAPEQTPKSIKKDALLELIGNDLDSAEILTLFGAQQDVVVQGCLEEWSMVKLLFFGNAYGDMSDFVIRDVGNAKFQQFDEARFSPSFESRVELEAVWNLRVYRQEFKLLEDAGEPADIYDWFMSLDMQYYLDIEKSSSGAQKLVHKVGYFLERHQIYDWAMEIYAYTDAAPSRERRVRIFNKTGQTEKALQLAQEILESPANANEKYFAVDVVNKEVQKTKSTTTRQKKGLSISISEEYRHKVEAGVVAYFEEMGYQAIHAENFIWRNLFGLIFWEIIFDQKYSAIHQPLQRRPSDLTGKDFYARRAKSIKTLLGELTNKSIFREVLLTHFERYHQATNPFVTWHEDLEFLMETLVKKLTLKQLKTVLHEMAMDPAMKTSGFPDLFVWNKKEYHFYEVKSPTDHLSEKQLFWLELFDQLKIKSEIVLVNWH